MSSLLSYHIFSFFISNIFENFKFGRNFSKFTAGMGCRLVAVSVKIGGNRRLPIGKENTGVEWLVPSRADSSLKWAHALMDLASYNKACFHVGGYVQ